jgi:REP element-mobilizing transposase RayT
MPDHVHMCIAIPPKHRVASVIGCLKGKSAIAVARLCGRERNFTGDTSGHAVTRCPRSDSNWNKSVNTFVNKKTRMEPVESSKPATEARFSATI